ncbi:MULTISPECIES: Crp/Fnr family transcriptional regulator [unclassified Roseitalea]|uniref:Crp/Fnr family transcriptional regulator n=1 Tax=unclassified Roseitalea TaxID=2639107 RepID=UPI00273FCB22|nr:MULTISPECIES: Crp/Fnr family transcriptional regulator [unclassified Roseitalea]
MQHLSAFALFAALDPEQDRRYSAQCSIADFDENELILDFEDETHDFFAIVSGQIRVILRIATGREMILGEIGEGSFFGELAAIDGSSRSANITALFRTRLLRVPQTVFIDILRENPEVALTLMRFMSQRIRGLNTRLAEHSFLAAKYRLYAELIRLSRPRKGHDGQRAVSPPPVQQDLAERIGCRREVVSREIARLEREGIIERTRGAIILARMGELNRRLTEGWDHGSK